MKPCRTNRKSISWLAVGALEPAQAAELRAHLEVCPGCRGYLDEISTVVASVSAAETGDEIQAPAEFHQNLLAALRHETAASNRPAWLRWPGLGWRMSLPVASATAVLIALLSVHRPAPVPSSAIPAAVPLQAAEGEPQPTIAHYQIVANRSLEELDELVTRQANRWSTPAPVQTAGGLSLVSRPD